MAQETGLVRQSATVRPRVKGAARKEYAGGGKELLTNRRRGGKRPGVIRQQGSDGTGRQHSFLPLGVCWG